MVASIEHHSLSLAIELTKKMFIANMDNFNQSTLHNTPFTTRKIIYVYTQVYSLQISLRCLILLQESALVYDNDENDTEQ